MVYHTFLWLSAFIEVKGKPQLPVKQLLIVPDVHGDAQNLVRVLTDMTNLVHSADEDSWVEIARSPQWKSKEDDTLLISLGDIVDRGPFALYAYEMLQELSRQRPHRVVRLLGNHEWLNIAGAAGPYIHPKEHIVFEQEGLQRQAAFNIHSGYLGKMLVTAPFKLLYLFAPETPGTVPPLSSKSMLFVHAGLEPEWAEKNTNVEKWNDEIVDKLLNEKQTPYNASPVFTSDSGPLWSREYALMHNPNDSKKCARLRKALAVYGVARMIVGHTPQESGRMGKMCGGRIILADVAMSKWMSGGNGNPAALKVELSSDGSQLVRIVALYGQDEEVLYINPKFEKDEL